MFGRAHPRYPGHEQGGGEKKYEERHGRSLDPNHDEVIGQVRQADALLIVGPDEARLELEARHLEAGTPSARSVDVETADARTDSQIVSKVREYFRNDR